MKLTESYLRGIIKQVIKETYHQNPPFGGMEQPHDYSTQISDTSSQFLEFVTGLVSTAKSRNQPRLNVDDIAKSQKAFEIFGNDPIHSKARARGLIKNNFTVKTDGGGKEYIQVIDYSKP